MVGYVNMFQEKYNIAQDLFLKSSEPKTALEVLYTVCIVIVNLLC